MQKVLLIGEVHGTKQSSKYIKKIIEAEGSKKIVICLELPVQLKRDIIRFIKTRTFTNKKFKMHFNSGYINPSFVNILKHALLRGALIVCVAGSDIGDVQYAGNLLHIINKYKSKAVVLVAGRYHLRDGSKICAVLKSRNVHFKRVFLLPNTGKFFNYRVRNISELDKFTVSAPAKTIKIGKTSPSYYKTLIVERGFNTPGFSPS